MPVGFEQWRAAVGAWSAKIGTPPSPRICSPWRGWMKRSDPLVYKAYLVHLLVLLDVVASVLQRFEMSARKSILGIRTAFDRTATCVCAKFRWIAIHMQSLDAAAVRLLSSKRCVHAFAFFSLVAMTLLIVSGDVEQNPGPGEDHVTINDVAEIQEELCEATDKWFSLGVQLKVSNTTLQSLMSASSQNPEYCVYQVLVYWLNNAPSPTWESLACALSSKTVAKLKIASTIRERHCIPIKNKEILKRYKRFMKRCLPTETVLGRGSYGEVSLWKSTHSDESYAGKKYLQPDSEKCESKLLTEIVILSEIDHKNCIQFKGITFYKTDLVLLMECMHTTLQTYVLKHPHTQLDNAWKLKIFYQIACGLRYLHTRNPIIIHRDLTANNVLLDSSFSVAKISDFSNARLLNFSDSSGTPSLPTKLPGTPQYMPPEADSPPYDTPLDIFSFGHLILFTVTEKELNDILSRIYYENGKPLLQSELKRREKYIDMAQRKLGVIRKVFLVMTRCLSDNPAERPLIETLVTAFQTEDDGHMQNEAPAQLLDSNLSLSREEIKGRHVFSLMEVYKLIINGEKRTRFKIALVCFTGLPNSGKTTLVENMIPNTEAAVKPVKGLVMYEIGFMPSPKDSMWSVKWEEFKREEIYIYMLARALAEETKEKRQLPSLEEWSDDKFPRKHFASDHLRNQFKRIYTKIRDELLNISESDYFHVILDPTYILLNVWDIGVSKALFEALPLLARLTNPLVLANLLDLSRDYGKKLREKPALLEEHREQSIMKGRSRCHYYIRIAGLSMCDSGSILIATNKDKVLKNEVEMRKRLIEAGVRAKASDMGVTKALSPEILAIDANNEEDCTKVKKHLETFVNSTTIFDQNLHLTWIFLCTALVDYKAFESDFRMPRSEFDDLALQCGLKTEQEIEECLKFFTKVGSLLYHTEFLRDNVIYRIDKFFVKLNELYVAHKRESHAKQSLEKGILCRAVARELWDNDTDFFWLLVQDAGTAAATVKNESPENKYDYNITCPCVECSEKECLYIPSLRKLYEYRSQEVKTDSLFITFSTEYVPTDIQAIVVKYMRTESCIPHSELKLTECYNSTEFELPNNGGNVRIIVHEDVVEIEIDERINKNLKIIGILKNLCITILDAVIKYFPGFEYELGFLCTCSKIEGGGHPERNDIHYLHFLPSQYDTHLYCQHCENMIELRQGQLNWMAAVFKGIESPEGLHEGRIIEERELEEIVSHMLPDYYIRLCDSVGVPSPHSISPAMLSANLVTGLKKWQLQSASNRWKTLARILLNTGSYKAALKLDAKLIYERRPVPPDEQALSPMER